MFNSRRSSSMLDSDHEGSKWNELEKRGGSGFGSPGVNIMHSNPNWHLDRGNYFQGPCPGSARLRSSRGDNYQNTCDMMVRQPAKSSPPQNHHGDVPSRNKKRNSPKNWKGSRKSLSTSGSSADTSPNTEYPAQPLTASDMWRGSSTSVCESAEIGTERGDADTLHQLHNRWKFWWHSGSGSGPWAAHMKELKSFSTVEEFWSIFNALKPPELLPINSSYFVFKAHVQPMWEDKENCEGGRWIVNIYKQNRAAISKAWMELLMAIIGENIDEDGSEITGVQLDIKPKMDRISIWTRSWRDEGKTMRIGQRMRDVLMMEDLNLGSDFYFDDHHKKGPSKYHVKGYGAHGLGNKTF